MPRKFPKDDNNEQLKRTNPDIKQLPEHCNYNSKNNISRIKCRSDANKKGKDNDNKWISENCIEPKLYVYNIGDAMGSASSSNFYVKKPTERGSNTWKNFSNESRSSKRSKRYFGKPNKKDNFNDIDTSNRFDVLNSHDIDSSVDVAMKESHKTTKNLKKTEIQAIDSKSTLADTTLEAMSNQDNITNSTLAYGNPASSLHSDPNLIELLDPNKPGTAQSSNNVSSRSDSEVRSPTLETALSRKKKKHKWEMGSKTKTKQKSRNEIHESKPIISDSSRKKSILKKEVDTFETNEMILPFDYSSGDDEIKTNKPSSSIENYVSDTSKIYQMATVSALSTRPLFFDSHHKPKKNVRFKNEVVIIYYSAENMQAVQNGSFIATTVEPLKLALQQQQRNRELRNKHAYARTMFPTSFSFGAF